MDTDTNTEWPLRMARFLIKRWKEEGKLPALEVTGYLWLHDEARAYLLKHTRKRAPRFRLDEKRFTVCLFMPNPQAEPRA